MLEQLQRLGSARSRSRENFGVRQDRAEKPCSAERLKPTSTLSSTRQVRKRRMFWNVRAMPARLILTAEADDALVVELTCPRWAVDAGDDVEGGGLAGAVRADQPDELAGVR